MHRSHYATIERFHLLKFNIPDVVDQQHGSKRSKVLKQFNDLYDEISKPLKSNDKTKGEKEIKAKNDMQIFLSKNLTCTQ